MGSHRQPSWASIFCLFMKVPVQFRPDAPVSLLTAGSKLSQLAWWYRVVVPFRPPLLTRFLFSDASHLSLHTPSNGQWLASQGGRHSQSLLCHRDMSLPTPVNFIVWIAGLCCPTPLATWRHCRTTGQSSQQARHSHLSLKACRNGYSLRGVDAAWVVKVVC